MNRINTSVPDLARLWPLPINIIPRHVVKTILGFMEVFLKTIISSRKSCLAHEHGPAIRLRTWKKIAHAFGIPINPHTSLQNLIPWDSGWTNEELFCEGLQEQAARLLAHLFVLESELGVPGAAARITYWNITSLHYGTRQ